MPEEFRESLPWPLQGTYRVIGTNDGPFDCLSEYMCGNVFGIFPEHAQVRRGCPPNSLARAIRPFPFRPRAGILSFSEDTLYPH